MSMSLIRTAAQLALGVACAASVARAQPAQPQSSAKAQPDTGTKIEIYGFAMVDAIGDFRTNDPNWFDVNRPSKLPAFENEFGHNGHTWFSARQTRFGAKAT